jgi:hypothetical protein
MAQPEPERKPPPPRLVHVPDAKRSAYVPEPGDIVLSDAQLSNLARLIGPAIERSLAKRRAAETQAAPVTND